MRANFYDLYGYCKYDKWIPKAEIKYNSMMRAICPKCGTALRMKQRGQKRENQRGQAI